SIESTLDFAKPIFWPFMYRPNHVVPSSSLTLIACAPAGTAASANITARAVRVHIDCRIAVPPSSVTAGVLHPAGAPHNAAIAPASAPPTNGVQAPRARRDAPATSRGRSAAPHR